jgi:hypothetical protein
MSGADVHSITRTTDSGVTTLRSQRTNSRTTAAGRATWVFDMRSNIWTGWQMLTVNSGWPDPTARTTPAVSGRLAKTMSAARTELRARRSEFESNCFMPLRPVLSRTVLAGVQGRPV